MKLMRKLLLLILVFEITFVQAHVAIVKNKTRCLPKVVEISAKKGLADDVDRATSTPLKRKCTVMDKDQNEYAGFITSVYDGDTFKITMPDLPSFVGESMSIRIMGIDAPEMNGKTEKEKTLAQKAKDFTYNALKKAKQVLIDIVKADKYGGRWDAHVYVDGQSLADALLAEGLVVEYDGGTKPSWA